MTEELATRYLEILSNPYSTQEELAQVPDPIIVVVALALTQKQMGE